MNDLQSRRIWLCWRYETRKGKRTKVPYAPSGCAVGTDAKFASSWVTYEEASEAVSNGFDGIGFVIPEGYFFLDVDHRDATDPYVQMLLERFSSYTEMSASGTGIHIYGKCDLSQIPTYIDEKGRRKLDRTFYVKSPDELELYIGGLTNRYAAFTGNAIRDVPLKECTQALLTTLDKDMRRKPKVRYSRERDGSRNNFDIICDLRKAKNGDKFSALFDEGDMSGYLKADGTPDHSRADCALCSMIAFRTGPDAEAIDSIFRDSALYRQKWEREDYREMTITAAIDACNGNFHRSVMPSPDFVKFDRNGVPSISVPLLARYTKEHLRYILVRDNGHQGIRLYVYEDGVYRHYATDMLQAVIKGYIEEYDIELVRMSKISEACSLVLTDLNYVRQEELNADEGIINFRNGLLRLSDMKLLPHSPDVLSTIQIPCDWLGHPTPTPVYDKYIRTLTDGDTDLENLCNEINGVVISNVKGFRLKKAAFFVGDGDTGKSQLKSLVEGFLGPGNYIGIDLREIEARFGTGAIYGTRLAGSSDMSFLSVGELKTFKSLTGGDSVFAEHKGKQPFEFVFNGFLWFCMNRLPKFGGDDGQWVFDRIMIIRCVNVIPKDRQDKMLLDKMMKERDGIIYKAVMALKTVIDNGYCFSEPKSVVEARQKYVTDNNTAIAFFQECMEKRSCSRIADNCTTSRVFSVYKAWCIDNNNGYAKTSKEFRDAIAGHLGQNHSELVIHNRNGNFYRDYTLTAEAKEQYRRAYGYDADEFLG